MYNEFVNIDLVKDHQQAAKMQAVKMRLIRQACAGQASLGRKMCEMLARALVRAANQLQEMAHSQPRNVAGGSFKYRIS